MVESARLSSSEQEEIVRELAHILLSSAPEGWQKMELVFHSTVGIDAAEIFATTTGEPERLPTPMAVARNMQALRQGMYEDGKGSWFTARLIVEPPGRYQITYDFDSEPTFVPPLTSDAYALDFEYFPRSDENTPDWLRQKLAEARQNGTSS